MLRTVPILFVISMNVPRCAARLLTVCAINPEKIGENDHMQHSSLKRAPVICRHFNSAGPS